MKRNYLPLHYIIQIILVILQSTLMKNLTFRGVKPDLLLVYFLFFTCNYGSFIGELSGFGIGLFKDILLSLPLGFNAAVYTIIGYAAGKLKGKVFFDPVFIPVVSLAAVTLVKYALSLSLSLIFLTGTTFNIFTLVFLIELVFNSILAPLIFSLLKLLKIVSINSQESYY